MQFWKLMLRLSLLLVLNLTANVAHATPPFGCAPGDQDNTCLTAIRSAPIPQPACSTAAGWTTAAAAVWIGSQWSQPQCSFQPAPTCPTGSTQTTAPAWNGAQWVGLVCAPPNKGGGDTKQMQDQCLALLPPTGLQLTPQTQVTDISNPPIHVVAWEWSPVLGPVVVTSDVWRFDCFFQNGVGPQIEFFPVNTDTPGGEGG
ncbi:hypothetical protein QYH69_24310 [Paraburkholderia sp. SARCC-3016]|uniref:hypothetical protein n=1 Tax=Paraburkholderia sp. SARCC-3016 TaxID=3058611 RepID=UPI002808CF86|nr:hypothetical protein [Paraburkholderia sp. SARCC-3016]MDQ7980366.1 hypothetical protein [Paraburkholderia sp. SARCC-3016]